MTIARARELLKGEAKKYSDDELKELIYNTSHILDEILDIVVKSPLTIKKERSVL